MIVISFQIKSANLNYLYFISYSFSKFTTLNSPQNSALKLIAFLVIYLYFRPKIQISLGFPSTLLSKVLICYLMKDFRNLNIIINFRIIINFIIIRLKLNLVVFFIFQKTYLSHYLLKANVRIPELFQGYLMLYENSVFINFIIITFN